MRKITQEEIDAAMVDLLRNSWQKMTFETSDLPHLSFSEMDKKRRAELAARPWWKKVWHRVMLKTSPVLEYFRILGLALVGRAQDMEQY